MEILGKIRVINETQTVGSSNFRKREVVVTTEEQYPQHILIEFTQDKCDILNAFHVGEYVKVAINIKGREWVNPQGETKFFNAIQGWKIERLQAENPATAASQNPYNQATPPSMPPVPAQPFAPATEYKQEDPDDLPF